jgi:hypothetical protein
MFFIVAASILSIFDFGKVRDEKGIEIIPPVELSGDQAVYVVCILIRLAKSFDVFSSYPEAFPMRSEASIRSCSVFDSEDELQLMQIAPRNIFVCQLLSECNLGIGGSVINANSSKQEKLWLFGRPHPTFF